ncbi:hypothetical protein RJ640_003833 [Escallonia rubra]|uniref:Interferon-related developmental regulator N-terminal domain-containing protein n=1 Tax=Escallonia rubra TaxID=112253 RepID=A0AA88R7U9_9ASTE|nr:hypothetical protein RJ640_003833 [Escallonia rubra]
MKKRTTPSSKLPMKTGIFVACVEKETASPVLLPIGSEYETGRPCRVESLTLLNKLAADLSIYTNLNPCSLPDSSGVQFISPDAVVSASSSLHSCLPEAEIFVGFWGTTGGGWLAITVGCGENAHELYEELLPPLSQALKSLSEPILDCLAIVTFVGGCTVEETERSMQIVWDFIHSGTGSSAVAKKHSAAVQIAAISAWSLLLTTVDEWSLKADDGSLHIVACEALALIFEMGCLEKFASGTDGTDASSIHEGNVFPNRFSSIQELREKLLVRTRALSLLAKVESSTTLSVKGKHNTEWDVLIILEENQLLHDVFDFTPKAKLSGDELYVSEREERIYRSPNSVFRKARTQILNKQRAIRAIAVEIATDSDANVKPALTSTPLKLDCCGAWGGYCKYALLICNKTVIFAWTTSGQCFPSKARNKA